MTIYEWSHRVLQPMLLPLHGTVRQRLLTLTHIGSVTRFPKVLDVGGRKSPYTIGIPARVTITDLPRLTEIQNSLHLGITPTIQKQILTRRSNIEQVLLDDMTRSQLPSASFDIVTAIEVLEHVEEDFRFVAEVARVLKPGGTFLMTTPNGDFVVNTNKDHKRHYARNQLAALLSRYFEDVEVCYAVQSGAFHRLGLRSWSMRRPLRTATTALSNVINAAQSSRSRIKEQSAGTQHLIATARRPRIGVPADRSGREIN